MRCIQGSLTVFLMISTAASLAFAQELIDLKEWKDPTIERSYDEPSKRLNEGRRDRLSDRSEVIPRLELGKSPDIAIYESELRYRMIWQFILLSVGFVLVLGMLHLIQRKLKIHSGKFWIGVCIIAALWASKYIAESYRAERSDRIKNLYEKRPSESDATPDYAPRQAK